MAWVGGGSDEYKVEAGGLNQTFVGMAFGVNLDAGRVIYGRLAGVTIGPSSVVLWLDGVQGKPAELTVEPSTEVWFSHYTGSAQIQTLLESIEKQVTGNRRP